MRFTIGEMAREFGLTLRTLRFYEDRGLVVPVRERTTRWFSEQDKVRLRTILQLKRLGFTLTEIRDMFAEASRRRSAGGVRLRPDQVSARIAYLERQRNDIDNAISALRNVEGTLAIA